MSSTLRGYKGFLLPITSAPTVGTTDPQALFQLGAFLRSRDKANYKFFTLLMKTQMFIRFIEERSFVADGDQSLAFFDECTERLVSDDADVRLLETDSGLGSERTIFLLPPESGNVCESFVYKTFTLDYKLMGSMKPHFMNINSMLPPGSPMARRTKHEIRSAQKYAR